MGKSKRSILIIGKLRNFKNFFCFKHAMNFQHNIKPQPKRIALSRPWLYRVFNQKEAKFLAPSGVRRMFTLGGGVELHS